MLTLKPPQWEVFQCAARFRVLVAGRRFGKTFLSLVELCRAAWSRGRLAWYVAPTYKQAKRIAWRPLKQMTQPYWAGVPNETDLRIELVTGGTVCLRGADRYDSLRGDGLDFLILDEYASIAPQAWPEVLRPALADRQGRALFSGTPRGFDHFYDLYQFARHQPEWGAFQYTTEQGGNVPLAELESATHDLDQRTYRQEFQASFENLTGALVYFAFDRRSNVEPLRYNPKLPLFWSMDFNVSPMCSVIGQRDGDHVYVLEELVLKDSNTVAACEAFFNRIAPWMGTTMLRQVKIYGDATGNGRNTAASRTDWEIVREFCRRYPYQFSTHMGSSNPLVRDRVNCVNALLCNQAGRQRLHVDPRCKELIQDFERVHWKKDPAGNTLVVIDKSDPARTHVSDALGYMIAREFNMYGKVGEMPGLLQ